MATINYNGMELEEVTEPQIFGTPRKCVVWDFNDPPRGFVEKEVAGILDKGSFEYGTVVSCNGTFWRHCALLPEKPAPRRATWYEVAKWCATGNGLVWDTYRDRYDTGIMWKPEDSNMPIEDAIKVRKWDDTEWHEPTVDYLGIGEEG